MKKHHWLPSIAVAFLLASPLALANGLSYEDPPPAEQRGELRERPEVTNHGPGNRAGGNVTDATGQTQQSTWSAWESTSTREVEELYFEGGGETDSTISPSSMLSGRLEWANEAWSGCKASASTEYCGTMVSGLRERSVWCDIERANGTKGAVTDGLCLTARGAKPEITRSCQTELKTNCVYPPVVVTVSALGGGPFLANGSDSVTLRATVRRTDGTIAAGETVRWSTSRGILSRSSTTTNSSGVTSVTLRSSSAGYATVRATAGTTRSTSVQFVSPVTKDYCTFGQEFNSNTVGTGYGDKAKCEKMESIRSQGYRSIRYYDDDSYEEGCFSTDITWHGGTQPRTQFLPTAEVEEGMWGVVYYKVWFDTRAYNNNCF